MTNRREFLIGAASVGVITATAVGADTNERTPAGLREHLVAEMQKARIPGMQVAVVQHGSVVFSDVFGYADVENPAPVTKETVFQIASCTKAFVAVALMQLLEEGKVNLDAPAAHYVEGLPSTWRDVTIGHLASHTSGLPDLVENLAALRLVVEGDAEASWVKVKTMPMEFTPGEKFNYVQTNYVLLGKIIDAVAGEPFGEFIRKRQLAAVGMRRTTYGDDHEVVLHSARTYTPYVLVDGKPKRTAKLYKSYIEFPPMLRTCGGLNSTAEEIARWIIALQHGSLFKDKSSLTTLCTARTFNDRKPAPWGIGGWVFDRPKHPVFFSVGAAKAAFAIYPKDDLAVVLLTNLSADLWLQSVDAIAAYYVPELRSGEHRA